MTLSPEYQPAIPDFIHREFGEATTEGLDSIRRLALDIIASKDQGRFDNYGGYPSRVRFLHDLIIWATVDHEGAPVLVCEKIDDFIAGNVADDDDYDY